MSTDFYTSAFQRGNDVFLRGFTKDGVRIHRRIPLRPFLFVPARGKDTRYKTLKGKNVEKIEFDSPREARDFLKKYSDVDGFEIYGMDSFLYPWINDFFPGEIEYDQSLISITFLDIEAAKTEDGRYAKPEVADAEITAITLMNGNRIAAFGCRGFKIPKELQTEGYEVTYHECRDEEDLLVRFLDLWRGSFCPDVVTGWNIQGYDIPYLYNRIRLILGEDWATKLSPWGIVSERTFKFNGEDKTAYTLEGMSILDYMEAYKEFTYTSRDSYSLNNIAFLELKEKKLDYSEYENLDGLYKKNFQLFMEYNIKDVILVKKLDDKLKFLELIFALAYDAKVNYEDTYATVRPWDALIHNYLLARNIVIPQFRHKHKNETIIGAYVKVPKPGMYKWVVSCDLTSLYPHILMQYNISPETLLAFKKFAIDKEAAIQMFLDGIDEEKRQSYIKQNLTFAPNGAFYDKDAPGFIPALMKKVFDDRSAYKKKMIEAKKKYEETKEKKYEYLAAALHNKQLTKKIQANSLYGALSNEWFRWYDDILAESVTMSGQLTVKWIERSFNVFLNKAFGTKNVDYVIYADTDSCYLDLSKLVDMKFSEEEQKTRKDAIADYLDKFSKTVLQDIMARSFTKLAEYVNAAENKMDMKREAITENAVFIAKKRYIMSVLDNEGVRYKEPELKVTGIEAVRSSTPAVCREKIKEALKILVTGDEKATRSFIDNFRKEFKKLPFEEIAFPRGCNGMLEYGDSRSIYRKGTPIHTRGALLYNNIIKEKRLDNKYQPIAEGDKIKFCYLKLPNPIRENVVACSSVLPRELGLEKYLDYDTQFDKAFLEPIKKIMEIIGWTVEEVSSLEDFFS